MHKQASKQACKSTANPPDSLLDSQPTLSTVIEVHAINTDTAEVEYIGDFPVDENGLCEFSLNVNDKSPPGVVILIGEFNLFFL